MPNNPYSLIIKSVITMTTAKVRQKSKIIKVGDKFGEWEVIEVDIKRYRSIGSYLKCSKCLCRCGVERIVLNCNLNKGISKSCGCDRRHCWADSFNHYNDSILLCELKKYFKYDANNGIFTRLKNSGNTKEGENLYGKNNGGYTIVFFNKKSYLAHRLAWLFQYGYMPKTHIDHINTNRSDNRICNLREATHSQNQQNKKIARIDSTIGLLGVGKSGNKYTSQIQLNGKRKYLGSFNTPEEAHEVYLKAKRELHEFCTI